MTHSERRDVVIVGASLAGLRAAEALRREGYAGRLTMVGAEEDFPPFDRPPLSKEVLRGAWQLDAARLPLFEDIDARLLLGIGATALHPAERLVSLGDGRALGYDGLVIATGTTVRRIRCPGSTLPGVHYLRTARDCAALEAQFRHRPRVVVIGGGFIGSEVASACRERNLDVTVVDLAELPMAEQTGQPIARYLMDQHRSRGVALRLGVGIDGIEGESSVRSVRLADGDAIKADLVIVGIGVAPETQWLSGSGLTVEDGVVCDEHCVSIGTPDIVAAGDVARWYNRLYGRHMRVEHWTNAVEQAEYAAAVLHHGTGGRTGYAPVPYFWSDQHASRLQFAGIRGVHETVVEGSLADHKFVTVQRDEQGREVGVLAINWPAGFQRHRRLLLASLASSPQPATDGASG